MDRWSESAGRPVESPRPAADPGRIAAAPSTRLGPNVDIVAPPS
jgi:hypothetical protein